MSAIATYPLTGGRGEKQNYVFQKRKTSGVATNVYSRKMLQKPKRDLRILKIRVRELFTHGEGISTSRTRHKERQPLIECAKMLLQYYLFYLFMFFFYFLGSTRVLPLLLYIIRCYEVFRPT